MSYMDFKKKVLSDNTFAEKFAGCKTQGELIAAAGEGYTFTAEDINDSELLPEELEQVAGGFSLEKEEAIKRLPEKHRRLRQASRW